MILYFFQRLFHTILFVGMIMLVVSCSEKKAQPPIPLKKMQMIMTDLHMAEYYSQHLNNDSAGKSRMEKNMDSLSLYYRSIFNHYHITLDEYNMAFNWYAMHPEMLDSIYSGMITATSELKIKYPEKSNIPAVKNDTNSVDSMRNKMRSKRDSINNRLLPKPKNRNPDSDDVTE